MPTVDPQVPSPDVGARGVALPAARATERFETCRCIIYAAPPAHVAGEGGPVAAEPTETEYRRCPVGLIAAVDCPEFLGGPCRCYVPRGDAPKTVVTTSEVTSLAAELAADGYPSERYFRRNRPLWTGTPVALRGLALLDAPGAESADVSATASVARTVHVTAELRTARASCAPINVPSDAPSAERPRPRTAP